MITTPKYLDFCDFDSRWSTLTLSQSLVFFVPLPADMKSYRNFRGLADPEATQKLSILFESSIIQLPF